MTNYIEEILMNKDDWYEPDPDEPGTYLSKKETKELAKKGNEKDPERKRRFQEKVRKIFDKENKY